MKIIFYFLLQVITSSGLLYGYYHLALRNKRFHQYNRFYLLGAVMISIIVPFLDIPVYFTPGEQNSFVVQAAGFFSAGNMENITVTAAGTSSSTHTPGLGDIARLFYGLVGFMLLLRLILSLMKLRKVFRSNPVEKWEGLYFVSTREPGTPFSFFRWLFWDQSIRLDSEKGKQVFRHELFHIRQRHSVDIIFLEMISIIFWINPFFHLIKKEIKAIHEFLADRSVVQQNSKWEYAELLLMQALQTRQPLVNPFFHNQIKRRIAMITSSNKTSFVYLRKLLVLPVALLVLALFSFNYKTKNNEASHFTGHTGRIEINVPADADKTSMPPDTVKPGEKVYTKVDAEAAFPGDTQGWKDFLIKNINPLVPVDSGAPAGKYTVMVQFLVDRNGELSGLKALTKHGYGMEQEVIRLMQKSPRWKPAIVQGKTVSAYRKQPVTFVVSEETDDSNTGENKVYDKVDAEATFPGGDPVWRQYLEYNIDKSVAQNAIGKAKKGTYSTIIQFIVRPDGTIYDLKPLTHHGYGMEEEVVRLLMKGPRWSPAIKDGQPVVAYHRVIYTFVIDGKKITGK